MSRWKNGIESMIVLAAMLRPLKRPKSSLISIAKTSSMMRLGTMMKLTLLRLMKKSCQSPKTRGSSDYLKKERKTLMCNRHCNTTQRQANSSYSPEQEAKLKAILNEEHNPIKDLIASDPQFALELGLMYVAMGVVALIIIERVIAAKWPQIMAWVGL